MLRANTLANAIHTVSIFSLPPGSIWALHTFYLMTIALMLAWYIRYEECPARHTRRETALSPAAVR